KPQLAFAAQHPAIVASAQKYRVQLADAARLAPELAVIQAHPALFAQLARYSSPSAIPPRLVAQAVAAAGGGTRGEGVLAAIPANQAAIAGVIAAGPQLQAIAPYAAQLQALAKVPPGVLSYLKQHGGAVQQAAARTAGQWKAWYWACFGGI